MQGLGHDIQTVAGTGDIKGVYETVKKLLGLTQSR